MTLLGSEKTPGDTRRHLLVSTVKTICIYSIYILYIIYNILVYIEYRSRRVTQIRCFALRQLLMSTICVLVLPRFRIWGEKKDNLRQPLVRYLVTTVAT